MVREELRYQVEVEPWVVWLHERAYPVWWVLVKLGLRESEGRRSLLYGLLELAIVASLVLGAMNFLTAF